MTESERLIAEGFFSEDFFKEEVRCNFLVTTERKKIWAIQLDMLNQVDAVCRKHGLQYFLIWGSLLGAVRHHGYIPWDDDVDIALPRKDYELLLTLKDEFPYPYFLQTPYTDPGYYYSFIKLRNCRTATIDYNFLYQGFNMGIFIDIFPLDAVIEEGAKERFDKISKLVLDNATAMRLTHPALRPRDQERVRNYTGEDPVSTYEKIQKLANTGESVTSDEVSFFVSTVYGFDRNMFKKEDFSSTIEWNFEGIKTFIPIGYERILTTVYGNYQEFPSVEERGRWHGNILHFPDVPYNIMVEKVKAEREKYFPSDWVNGKIPYMRLF